MHGTDVHEHALRFTHECVHQLFESISLVEEETLRALELPEGFYGTRVEDPELTAEQGTMTLHMGCGRRFVLTITPAPSTL